MRESLATEEGLELNKVNTCPVDNEFSRFGAVFSSCRFYEQQVFDYAINYRTPIPQTPFLMKSNVLKRFV